MEIIKEILGILSRTSPLEYTLLFVLLVGSWVIKMPKTDKNMWQIVSSAIGEAYNKGVMDRLDEIEKHFNERIDDNNTNIQAEIQTLGAELELRIANTQDTVEKYRAEGIKRDIFAKADRLHDDILLQADKMRLAGKYPGDERMKVLYNKVLEYEDICKMFPEEYNNGVCIEACQFIKDTFKERYRNPEKK